MRINLNADHRFRVVRRYEIDGREARDVADTYGAIITVVRVSRNRWMGVSGLSLLPNFSRREYRKFTHAGMWAAVINAA